MGEPRRRPERTETDPFTRSVARTDSLIDRINERIRVTLEDLRRQPHRPGVEEEYEPPPDATPVPPSSRK